VGQDQCTNSHGGTSAAAPLAAGVFALVLSIRPDLTWRDMQYLCVQSAVPLSLADPDWTDLPSGRKFNHRYGYGVVDAYRMVELAKTFQNVRPQTKLELGWKSDVSLRIPDIIPTTSGESIDKEKALTATIAVTQDSLDFAKLATLEHVTSTLHIEHKRRGDLEILLESPNGIISQLATPRNNDESLEGFQNWTFMTVKHW
jgi:kexin